MLIVTMLLLLTQLVSGNNNDDEDPCKLPKYCTPAQVMKCVKSVRYESSYYSEVIADIIALTEPYVYLDILKNPPQPAGFPDYFKPVDLIGELRAVDTNATDFYEFLRSVKRVLNMARDGHFVFQFLGNEQHENKALNFFALPPVALAAMDGAGGQAEMYAAPMPDEVYDAYPNGAALKEAVLRNANASVESINGKTPFDFVAEFGAEYYNFLKNSDARYTFASYYFARALPLISVPLEAQDFSNLTIAYSSGEVISTDLLFFNADPTANVSANGKQEKMSFAQYARAAVAVAPRGSAPPDFLKIAEEYSPCPWQKKKAAAAAAGNGGGESSAYDEEALRERLQQKKQQRSITDSDIMRKLESKEYVKLAALQKNKYDNNNNKQQQQQQQKEKEEEETEETANDGLWTYSTNDEMLKCKADNENAVNVYLLRSFAPKDIDDFLAVLLNCAALTNSNEYPTIVIDDANGGGYVALAGILHEMLQPDAVTRSYASFKADPRVRRVLEATESYAAMQDPASCETYGSIEAFYAAGIETDSYGAGITHNRTVPALPAQLDVSLNMFMIRPGLTRHRRPTDIAVFTDSFSFSAGAFFTKGLRDTGSAILVGYNGYPGSKKETFDIGQSPTTVFQTALDALDPEAFARLEGNGFCLLSLSAGETFRPVDIGGKTNATLVPREFLFDAPDERVPIYGEFEDGRYGEFVAAAKKIFDKYRTHCNPDNPRLHLRDRGCSLSINRTHMHGGFVCGQDAKWFVKCEAYYCDVGFVYDEASGTCLQDMCYEEAKGLLNSPKVNIGIIIIVVILFIAVLASLIALLVFCVRRGNGKTRNDPNDNFKEMKYREI